MAKKPNKLAGSFLSGLNADTEPAAPSQATPVQTGDIPQTYEAFLDITDIQPHPYNREVNIEDEAARALMKSIIENGFTDKVLVLTKENARALGVEGLDERPYVALNCHHRIALCKKYRPDITSVEAVVRYFQKPLDMMYVLVDYNAARPLKTSERAKQIHRIKGEVAKALEPGQDTLTVIATRLGRSRTLVYMLDSIHDLPLPVLEYVDTGDIILQDAVSLRKRSAEELKILSTQLTALPKNLEPESRKQSVRKLVAAASKMVVEVPKEETKKQCDLAKAVSSMARLLPSEGDEILLPKYKNKLDPMIRNLDRLLPLLADYRTACADERPIPPEVRRALQALLDHE